MGVDPATQRAARFASLLPQILRKYIYGGHVGEYMEEMMVRRGWAFFHPGVGQRWVWTVLPGDGACCLRPCAAAAVGKPPPPRPVAWQPASIQPTANLYCLVLPPLQEEDPEKYQTHFAEYLKNGVEPDDLEDLYTKVTEFINRICGAD